MCKDTGHSAYACQWKRLIRNNQGIDEYALSIPALISHVVWVQGRLDIERRDDGREFTDRVEKMVQAFCIHIDKTLRAELETELEAEIRSSSGHSQRFADMKVKLTEKATQSDTKQEILE